MLARALRTQRLAPARTLRLLRMSASASASAAVLTDRVWHSRGASTSEGSLLLRVATYNVLAQVYTRSNYQTWSPPACLKWKARSAALLRDLDALSCDLLLLQEVDEESFWKAALAERGYATLHKPRTQSTAAKKDGVLLAWRERDFALLASAEIEHNSLAAGLEPGSEAAVRLTRDCVGLLACLQASSGKRLVVGTTHIFWDPAWEDVKDAQTRHFVASAAAFRAQHTPPGAPALPLLLGGDFNSMPGSAAHRLLLNEGRWEGTLPLLRSVFSACGAAEPETTNHTPSFSATLDYLVVTGGEAGIEGDAANIEVAAVLQLPPRSALGVGCPDSLRPSDHLPLVAQIRLL